MAVWLTVRYLMAIRSLTEKDNAGEPGLKVLREFCHDVVALRRGDHSAARLKMEQERFEREREKTEEEVLEHFKRWVKNPQVRDWICQNLVSPEERERRIREIFGRAPKPPDEAATNGTESNPVKPDQTESNQMKTPTTSDLCYVTHIYRRCHRGCHRSPYSANNLVFPKMVSAYA